MKFIHKLIFIATVCVTFTVLNIIHHEDWKSYILSIIILPSLAWLSIEFVLKLHSKYITNG